MDRPILPLILFLLAVSTVRGESPWYSYTNEQGRLQFSQAIADTVYAVGAVQTSAVMPEVASEEVTPIQSPPIEVPYLVIQDVDDSTAWGIYIDDGDIIGGILDHASPRDPVAIKARLQAERQVRRDLRQDVRTVRTNMVAMSTSTNTAPAQAQQIGQLRKAVRDLSAAILKLTKDQAP